MGSLLSRARRVHCSANPWLSTGSKAKPRGDKKSFQLPPIFTGAAILRRLPEEILLPLNE